MNYLNSQNKQKYLENLNNLAIQRKFMYKKIYSNPYSKNINPYSKNIKSSTIYSKTNTPIELNEPVNSVFYNNFNLSNENDKYFSYINLKNFFYNFKVNEDVIIHKYLKPKISLEKGKRESIIILNEWGYPPYGGGENWILDTCRIMNKQYDCYMLCFRNQINNYSYDNYEIINLDYCKIILMKKDISEIFKIIYDIKPKLICHQGVERIFAMKIANCLGVPFVSGFCFWNDMITFGNNTNINMINTKQIIDKNYKIIKENSYVYCVSKFMNDILIKSNEEPLNIIESISLKENYTTPFNVDEFETRKYVSILNIHSLKGGKIILHLLKNLNKKIPLLLINTERLNNLLSEIETAFVERNSINNINLYFNNKVNNIQEIYKISRIILVPSIVDETFCRVGYEAMMNGIPTFSSNAGNLKYLLNGYANFIDPNDHNKWLNEIESIYFNKTKCLEMSKRPKTITSPEIIYQKYIDFINSINEPKFKLNNKRIGILVPWADQGLGIQGRELYITLEKIGFEPYVFSFKPYLSTPKNLLMQVDATEWNYKNIYYSENKRENISENELIEFVFNYKISKILIPELCYSPIFKTLSFLKLMNIKIYGLVNIETTRIDELVDHLILDKILTNNKSSYEIMKTIFDENKVKYLGFGMNHPYFQELKLKRVNKNKIKFITFGGLNAITRKNIKSTITVFSYIERKTNIKNWELHIYIQGNELIDNKLIDSPHIKYHIGNMNYKNVIQVYLNADITIHLGDHEGLGLGFYESLNCYTPILTLNCYPNCEIIENNKNGWLIDCQFENFTDNNKGLVKKGKINNNIYLAKITEILITNFEYTINIIKNCSNLSSTTFEKNLKTFLLENN